MNFFITGTDTGVGKTFVSALLIRSLRKAGLDTVGMKPICCGDREDAEQLHDAAEHSVELNEINPVWLRPPAAPYTAALIENRMIDLEAIRENYTKLRNTHRSLLVEGVGGWLVPIRKDYFVRDLAAEFGLPILLVVPNRLGALNHALLTIQSIQASGQTCGGIIFNHLGTGTPDIATVTNRSMLEDLTDVPILFEIEKDQQNLPLEIA